MAEFSFDLSTKSLEENNWKVDFVFTHECPTSDLLSMHKYIDNPETYPLTNYLEEIKSKLDYNRWYFGHYHDNKQVSDKYVLLYEDIKSMIL